MHSSLNRYLANLNQSQKKAKRMRTIMNDHTMGLGSVIRLAFSLFVNEVAFLNK